ncbi:MAG TPA: hypothetical protein VH496_16295 [Mycobacterium sp.]
MTLHGTPSDDLPAVLDTGRGDVGTLFVSMAMRHPDGLDADYLRWHTLDHRPEQHRLSGVRASMRLVSTPACRSARATGPGRFDAIDHVMTYFFTDADGLKGFYRLSDALGDGDRKIALLPPVQRGVYEVQDKIAAPRIKAGADVLPWWPARGVYWMFETAAAAPTADLVDVEGVGGVWSAAGEEGHRVTYCFLDDDPVAVAERMRPVLEKRWESGDVAPLLAAPFHLVAPYEWDRYVP